MDRMALASNLITLMDFHLFYIITCDGEREMEMKRRDLLLYTHTQQKKHN